MNRDKSLLCERSLYNSNRVVSQLPCDQEALRAYVAQDRNVLNVHEDLSTGATTQSPSEVELCKRSYKQDTRVYPPDIGGFFPIYKHELHIFIPMAVLMFCILYSFAALHSIKDILIIPLLGPEVISFIKLWFVLPSAIVFTIFYIKLNHTFSFDKVFYIVISFFALYFLFFTLWIHPNIKEFHTDSTIIHTLSITYPHFKWLIKIIGNWSYCVVYIFSELWSVVAINLMFWQFSNNIVTSEQVKRFYPSYGLISNLGIVFAGVMFVYLSKITSSDNHSSEDTVISLSLLSVVLMCGVSMLIMWYINRYVLNTEDRKRVCELAQYVKQPGQNTSIIDTFKFVMGSKDVLYITVLVICYSLAINVVEGPWKVKVMRLYPDRTSYTEFLGYFNILMGVCCVVSMFIGSHLIRRLSWCANALVTPILIGASGGLFFISVIFGDYFTSNDMQMYFIVVAVLAGSLQNILSKAVKYSFFDITKEMVYVNLDYELRNKGKAAVEVLGVKFGKSLGAIIQSSILAFFPVLNLGDVTPVLMIVFFISIFLWIIHVLKINANITTQQ